MARLLVCILLVLAGPGTPAAPGPQPAAGGDASGRTVLHIPLDDGRLEVRAIVEAVLREAGVEAGPRLEGLDWSIDVGSTLGRLELDVFDRIAEGAVSTEVGPDEVEVTIDRRILAQKSGAVIERIEQWAGGAIASRTEPRRFGLTVVTPDDPRAPLEAALPAGTARAVVLVHGLDDPGWVWRDLTAALLAEGYVVIRFEYPNDQPVADSADLLASSLEDLRRETDVEQIDLVAHSMGGLVSRDLLTRKAYYAGDGSGGDRYPAVGRLIMLGTPNHGAPLARLRGVSELGEFVSRWVSGEASWRDSLTDGAGEAGRDLLPDSDFLRRLNDRPQPAGTAYTIVAGRMSPLAEDEVDELVRRWSRLAGAEDGAAAPQRVSRLLKSVVRGAGDGLVSLESARIEGVEDFVEIEADHMGMIVDVFPSDEIPPGISIVLERLQADSKQ